jgi:hypothetical protein
MDIIFGIIAAILLVFLIFQGKSLVPRIISFLAPGDRKLYFEEFTQEPLGTERQETLRPVIEKLEILGFSMLGMMVEKPPLWAHETREIAMASASNKIFASIGLRRNNPSYFLYTPFAGGEVVITAHNSFRDYFKDDFATAVVNSGDLEEMLEVHKKQVENFIEKGRTPYQEYTRESFIRATNLYYSSPYPRKKLRVAGIINLLFFLFLIFLFAIFFRAAIT